MSHPQKLSRSDVPGRRIWVLYRLQSLPTSRLITVVNRILRGEEIVIKPALKEPDDYA